MIVDLGQYNDEYRAKNFASLFEIVDELRLRFTDNKRYEILTYLVEALGKRLNVYETDSYEETTYHSQKVEYVISEVDSITVISNALRLATLIPDNSKAGNWTHTFREYENYASKFLFRIDDLYNTELSDLIDIKLLTTWGNERNKYLNLGYIKKKILVNGLIKKEPFISRSKLRDYCSSSVILPALDDDNQIETLQARITQLENQLEQAQSIQHGRTYTTPAIEAMEAVIKEFWQNYDPDTPAPKQYIIKQWLLDNFDTVNSDALATAIDKICRHPTAKTGGQFKKK